MRIDEAVETWLGSLASPHTRAAYRRDMAVFVAWARSEGRRPEILVRRNGRPTGHASNQFVAGFREHCETSTMSAATRSRRISTIASFVRFTATPLGERSAAEAHTSGTAQATVALEPEVSAAVWRASVASGPRSAALVGLILHEGLKLGETIALDVGEVDFTARPAAVMLRRRATTVEVQLGRRTTTQLVQLIGQRRGGPVFESESAGSVGARLTRFGADYLIKAVGQRASLTTPLTTNELRSTHIAMSRRSGESPAAIHLRLGHRSIQTTNRYIPRSDEKN